jgi:hypothetical protein
MTVDLNILPEISRIHCVSICAFLIPAILITTLQSILLVIFQRRDISLTVSVLLSLSAIAFMVFHVSTWFVIGVVTPVTFILLGLSLSCLTINLWLWLKFARQNHGGLTKVLLRA